MQPLFYYLFFFQNCFYCKKTTAVEIRGILKLLQKMAPQNQMVSVYILYKFKNIKNVFTFEISAVIIN